MSFREHEGFKITKDDGIKRPKGVPRKKKQIADRQFLRGDRIATTEDAVWLNPRYRTQTAREIRDNLGR